jgi:predicted secreted protein
MLVAREEVDAVFCLEKDYASKADSVPTNGWLPSTSGTYSGKVIITALESNAPNGDNATFTASFEGVGALTKTTGAE